MTDVMFVSTMHVLNKTPERLSISLHVSCGENISDLKILVVLTSTWVALLSNRLLRYDFGMT